MSMRFNNTYDLHDYYSRQLYKFTLNLYFKKMRASFYKHIDNNFMNLFINTYEQSNDKNIKPEQIKEFGIIIKNNISHSEFKTILINYKEYYYLYLLLENIYQSYKEYNILRNKRQQMWDEFEEEHNKLYPKKKMIYRNKKQ